MIAMRVMGKRQLGELQPSELVVTLLLSDLAAVPMQENGLPLFNGILPILVLVALEISLSALMLKFAPISRLISGTLMRVIKDGKVYEKVMRRMRITADDLIEALREQNIFDLRQVQYAIAETNGHISVFCYPQYQPATLGDVSTKKPPDVGMPVIIISDGRRSDWGLSLCNFDDRWLDRQLKKHNYTQEQIFLLTATKKGDVFILTKDDVN
jgi:uncharacterized membrane protein YcaP (DUF421 family)